MKFLCIFGYFGLLSSEKKIYPLMFLLVHSAVFPLYDLKHIFYLQYLFYEHEILLLDHLLYDFFWISTSQLLLSLCYLLICLYFLVFLNFLFHYALSISSLLNKRNRFFVSEGKILIKNDSIFKLSYWVDCGTIY